LKIPTQILLLVLDIIQNTSTRNYFNFYKQATSWNRETIRNYQLTKIKSLINYAQQNVPYYKNLLNSKNFNIEDIKSIAHLSDFPILTRNDIQANRNILISDKYRINKLEKSSSSGTTGIPIEYFSDRSSISSGIAAGYFAFFLSGWQPGYKTLHIWGNPTTVKYWGKKRSKLKRYLKNQTNLASTEFNDSSKLPEIYRYISNQGFTTIDGYTTAIYELARFIEINSLSKIKCNQVFTTAENLLSHQKMLIEKNIGPSSDLYGCGEIHGIAIRPIHEDKYFIIDPHVVVEVEQSNENFKSIIVTDLDNKAMPLIRYKVGDLIDEMYEPKDDQKFQLSYFNKVLGRDSDIVVLPNGKKILPVNIVGGTLFRLIGGISKHKVVWNGRELIFYFETGNDFNFERAQQLITKEFIEYCVSIKIEVVEKLMPDKNGKYRYFEKAV
jgi:phenylacetate-CoA ligase